MSRQVDNIKINIEKATKAILDEAESVLRLFLEKVRTEADGIIRSNKAYASGEMMKNLRIEVIKEMGKIIGVVGTGANVPHAIYRHEGTKPHFPPLEPLQKWVILKGLIKIGGKSTTESAIHRSKNADDYMSEVKSIALAIARKIAAKGTVGLPFLRMAFNQNREFLMAQMAKVKI